MKKTPHFFKIHSRFGLIHLPYKFSELNIGVEDGSDAILSKDFLSSYPSFSVSEFNFPRYEDIDKSQYKELLAQYSKECIEFIQNNIKTDEQQIVIGGDHSVTFPSFAVALQRFDPQRVGYIQFDSQGDIHTFLSSHSGNFHGMFVRPFVDTFDYKPIEDLIPHKLPRENLLYLGNLDLEIEEIEYFKQNNIRNIVKQEMQESPEKTLEFVSRFINKFEHIHITFDVDVFNRSLVTATGTPAPDGWMKDDIFQILNILNKHKSFTFDLVEVNPKKENAEPTISLAQEVLQTILI